jgi:hypothetical protein
MAAHPRGPSILALLTAALLVGTGSGVSAQTPVPPERWGDHLTLEVWSIADRIIHGDEPVEDRLLREARYTISGMIYGFEFVYTPEYPARKVDRYFTLEPTGQIPWGDTRLHLRDLRDERTTLYGLIDYELSENDRIRLRSWRNSDVERAAGHGAAPLLDGLDGKIAAIEDAVHHALREHLRDRYFNRPREVTGTVVLREPPRIRTRSGMYEAQVLLYIHIRDVREYLAF